MAKKRPTKKPRRRRPNPPQPPQVRPVLVRLDAAMLAELDKIAAQWKLSREGVIRAALGEWMQRQPTRRANKRRDISLSQRKNRGVRATTGRQPSRA